MPKYISQVHENHPNNPIKLMAHLLICFGSDFTLALGAVYNQKPSQPGTFCEPRKKKTKEDSLFGKWPTLLQTLIQKTKINQVNTQKKTMEIVSTDMYWNNSQ